MIELYHTSQHVTQLLLFTPKICNECKTEKFLELDFQKRYTRNGYETKCKVCRTNQQRIRNKAKPRKPLLDASVKRERRLERCHQYHQKNLEKERARKKSYSKVYREEKKAEYGMSTIAKYYATYPNKLLTKRERNSAWKQANPHKVAEQRRRREARKKELTTNIVNYDAILARDGMWCYICERDILPCHKLHFDHVIPIKRNGAHTEDNIKPSHAICNARKGTYLIDELTPLQRRGPNT